MSVITRERVLLRYDSSVPPTTIGIDLTPILPIGETWQVVRFIFADPNNGDNISAGFQVDYGSGGTWEFVNGGYLSGNTSEIILNKTFTGDGIKRFRAIRNNLSASAKTPLLIIEAFKRLGD